MKLDRLVLVLGAAALAACASAPAPRAETTLTSAATAVDASAGPAVRSSKVQRAEPSELAPKDEDEDVRREPSRRSGFGSGWK